MYGLEGLRKFPGDQGPQVRGRSDDVPLEHPEEPPLHYDPAPSSPPVPPVVAPHLFCLNTSDLNRKIRASQEVRKAHELLEELVQALAPRRLAADWLTVGRSGQLQNPTLVGHGIDQGDAVMLAERAHFPADRSETARLNLDNVIAAQQVDNVAIQRCFQHIPRPGIPALQRRMQRLLIEETNCRHQ